MKENESKVKQLKINAKDDFCFDTKTWYKNTKPFSYQINAAGLSLPKVDVTTWAGLLRGVVQDLQANINKTENFEEKFNNIMTDVFKTNGFQFNTNFSQTLFEDDSFITSTVYRNNQNHKLEVCKGKYICAVYTSEVITVINGIVKAIGGDCEVIITYEIRKGNIRNDFIDLSKNINDLLDSVPDNEKKEVSREVVKMLKDNLDGRCFEDEDGFRFIFEIHDETQDRILEERHFKGICNTISNIKKQIEQIEAILKILPFKYEEDDEDGDE